MIADRHGHCLHLHERDCSLQRRYQKVIEDCPAPGLSPALRERLDDAAVRARLEALVAQALQLDTGRVGVVSDITLAYLDCFAPGAGYLVYAGTGSIAVGIEPDGHMHRAGGRGGLLDDGGSGYWIAREALQHIWRGEDEAPGCWSHSALARRVFDQIGGSSWAQTRAFVYQGSRGEVGELACGGVRPRCAERAWLLPGR